MDLQTFNSLKSQLKDEPFFSDKKSTLESFLQNYWFSGEQAAKVIGNFPHSSEKTEVLALIKPRLTVLTGVGARKVVAAFTFADDKLKAVGLVANHINDPVGKYDVLEAIDFAFDKEKARKILDKARPPVVAQCPAGQPQPYSQPPTTTSSCPPVPAASTTGSLWCPVLSTTTPATVSAPTAASPTIPATSSVYTKLASTGIWFCREVFGGVYCSKYGTGTGTGSQ
ncbi:uncharacterized protein LOC135334350 [Halichondria panicea]|uniref:uncharacterized protein LOC135334350 n=1 Tax=Halichondria panicea TaxID=6063 RepID=UPI00312B3C47